ncbi:MAG: alpha/beta fold hydrolase [Alphaproteobacteria bacterium]|nr:alpha/beta fold hydrolase [Alphaproteobacteria bacterium]
MLYFHGPWGLDADRPFVKRLADRHTVYAPKFLGTSRDDPNAIHVIDDWLDLLVYHAELIEKLALTEPSAVGHSFGALLAAEIAAASPSAIGKLAMVAPVGLWSDERPVKNWMVLSDTARRAALFPDPDSAVARQFFDAPKDLDGRVDKLAKFIWAQACSGKFVWPVPDRGFKNRSHRIAAPALIIWGAQDSIVAPAYAQDFARLIKGARVAMIADAGHLPHLEQRPPNFSKGCGSDPEPGPRIRVIGNFWIEAGIDDEARADHGNCVSAARPIIQ